MLRELRRPFTEQGQQGYVLLLVLITSITLFISMTGILSLSLANLSSAKRTMFDSEAVYAAEAGVDSAIQQLNATNGTYSGTGSLATCTVASPVSPVVVFNDSVKGKGTYETCVANGTITHEKYVYAIGRVYKTASDVHAFSQRKLKVVVYGSPVGAYSVQTGPRLNQRQQPDQ
jgi:Tfp pilus assembly protein PilX